MLLLMQLSENIQKLSEHIDHKTDPDIGYCLHAAIMSGNINSVASLLRSGCDPNAVYSNLTPLNLCLSFHKRLENTVEMVKLLIKHGANVNLCSSLHTACRKGLMPLIEILLENGATPDMLESSSGLTPLQCALNAILSSKSTSQISMYSQVALTLLRYSELDVTNQGLHGPSPLQLSILTSQAAIILTIITKGSARLSQQDLDKALELMESSFVSPADDDSSSKEIVGLLKSLKQQNCASLQELSRNIIRKTMSRRLSGVQQLSCPTRIKSYILLADVDDKAYSMDNDDLILDFHNKLPPVVSKSPTRQQLEHFLKLF